MIPGRQPFPCTVVPAKLFSAFTNSNVSTTAGEQFTLLFLGRDRFQNTVNSVDDVVVATLSRDTSESPLNSIATFSGNGIYKAVFLLTKSGLYSIIVQINNYTSQKNPHTLTCNPEQVSNPGSSGLSISSVGNSTELLGQDSTAGTTGVWVIIFVFRFMLLSPQTPNSRLSFESLSFKESLVKFKLDAAKNFSNLNAEWLNLQGSFTIIARDSYGNSSKVLRMR